jgi:hypothetical protein
MSNQNFKVRKGIDAGDIVNAPVFNSTVTTGTAPLTVASTTVVTNLNANLLGGYQASALPISTATQSALNLKSTIASPTFTGQVTVPEGTASAPGLTFTNDGAPDTGLYHIADGSFGATCNTQPVATFTTSGVNLLLTPTAPTATAGTSTTQLATTAFVTTADNLKANNSDLLMAIGNINAPLLDMPLKNSLAMKSGVGSATFTRTSTATYIDRYGVLQTSAVDTPRFEKEGYLNEGASTNLLLQSNNMMTFPWSSGLGGYVTQTTDNSTVPFSSDVAIGLNVTKFIATSTPNIRFSSQALNLTSSTTYTASVFMYVPSTYGSTFSFKVDFSGTDNGNTNTYPTGAWARATSTLTITTGSTSNVDFNISIDGVAPVVNDTWYCVAPQLEALPFASSYIPTVASTVTRAVDNFSITSIGNSNGVTNRFSEETLIVDFATLGGSENYYRAVFEFNGQTTAYRAFYNTSASSMTLQYGSDAVSGSQIGVGNATLNVMTRYSLSHNNLGVTKSYMNGVYKYSGSSGTSNSLVPSTAIIIGSNVSNDAGSKTYGHYSNFRIYDRALTAYEVALA